MSRGLERIINSIEDEIGDYNNYDSALDYAEEEESVLDYDSALDYYEEDSIMSMVGDPRKHGLSNYSTRTIYEDNSGSGASVEVEFFGTDFNVGNEVGASLVFTNNFGDTGTITGITANFIAFQNQLRYAPFRVAYARMSPQDQAQFQELLTFRKDSVLGGFKGNTITPNDYLTPEQFQLLRVDIPMNAPFNGERRMLMNLLSTETVPGVNIIFWISQLEQNIRKLQNKPSVIQMQGQGLQNSAPSISTRDALNDLMVVMEAKRRPPVSRRPAPVSKRPMQLRRAR